MIPLELIQSYLSARLGGAPFALEPISGLGDVNQVYSVETGRDGYVLRVNQAGELPTYLKETWCCRQAARLGIPVPDVLDTAAGGGASFMLLARVPGQNCALIADESFQLDLYRALGEYARALSGVVAAADVGNLYSGENARRWFEQDYLAYEIRQTSDPGDYLALSEPQRAFVLGVLDGLARERFDFALCHGDLSPYNCLWDAAEKRLWLIDFGSAETHVKDVFEAALKWLEVHYEHSLSQSAFLAFLDGMTGAGQTWLDAQIGRVESLALLYTLDKYRWAHDRNPGVVETEYLRRFYGVLELLQTGAGKRC